MINQHPRAFGVQICKECGRIATANSREFSDLLVRSEGKVIGEKESPTCYKCLEKKKEPDPGHFISQLRHSWVVKTLSTSPGEGKEVFHGRKNRNNHRTV